MTRLLPFLTIVLSTPFCASAQSPIDEGCERETDEFKGTETIRCRLFIPPVIENPIGEIFPSMRLTTESVSVDYSDPPNVFIFMGVESSTWLFRNESTAYFLADGERMEAPVRSVDNYETRSGKVVEQKTINLKHSQVRRMSRADTVQMKLGRTEFRLDSIPEQAEELLQLMGE